MLRILAKGLLGRVLGYAGLVLGFWLLFQGFSKSSPHLGVIGGLMMPLALYLIVLSRQSGLNSSIAGSGNNEEEEPIDCVDGSDSSGKLPP